MNDRRLNDLMGFGHVITVTSVGSVSDGPPGLYAPEPWVETDEEGSILDLKPSAIGGLDGWHLLNGHSRQDGYSGPIMHESEYIGGSMAHDILANPGHYAAVTVTGLSPSGEDDIVGWAVAYRDIEED